MIGRLALCLAALLAPALAAADDLADTLALPFASGLAGARHAPIFAWIEERAGNRTIWVGGPRLPAHARTVATGDDGVLLSDVAVSDDGHRLLFVRGGDPDEPDGDPPNAGQAVAPPEPTLFVAAVAGTTPPIAIGAGHGGVFSPDGGRVAFVRRGGIWLWRDGAVPVRLAAVTGGVTDLRWSPDGTRLVFVEARSEHTLIGLVDPEPGTLRYLGATLGQSAAPVFSPDGRHVAFVQYRDPPAELAGSDASFWSLRIADVADGRVGIAWTAPHGAGGRWSPTDGRALAWSAAGTLVFPWERSGWRHLYALPAAGGEARDLTPAANEVESYTLQGGAAIYAANPGDPDTRGVWRAPLNGGAPVRLTPATAFAFAPVAAGPAIAATVTDARHPAHMALVDGMAPLGPVATAPGFVPPRIVTLVAADGLTVHAQLFEGRGRGPHPALVYVHGGPARQMLPGFHPMHYYSNAYALNQHLAAEGYTVLSVNYRSGTGYGHDFREAPGVAREGAAEYRDVLAAGRWLAHQPGIDPARIGIWGGSWGGYLTALALARDSDLFRAGADFHGVHAMVRPVEATLSPDAAARAHQRQWDSSPMAAIERWRSPVLLVHGDDDHDVDYRQSLLLARELAARSVPFDELSLPNERHGFLRHADWLASYRATDAFFARTLARR